MLSANIMAMLKSKIIDFNKQMKISNAACEEFPVIYEKEGMQSLIISTFNTLSIDSAIRANTRIITIEEDYGHLGERYILNIILEFESGTRIEEAINVSVDEKRKPNSSPSQGRCVLDSSFIYSDSFGNNPS